MTLEKRLIKLESELVSLKKEEVAKKICAQEFCLVNKKGELRAVLSMYKDNPSLELYASKGESCARLAVIGDDAVLTLIDKDGNDRVMLA